MRSQGAWKVLLAQDSCAVGRSSDSQGIWRWLRMAQKTQTPANGSSTCKAARGTSAGNSPPLASTPLAVPQTTCTRPVTSPRQSCHISPYPRREHSRLSCSNSLEHRSPALPQQHPCPGAAPGLPPASAPSTQLCSRATGSHLAPHQRSRLREKPGRSRGSRGRQATVPRTCAAWGRMAPWNPPEPGARHRKAGGRTSGAGRR